MRQGVHVHAAAETSACDASGNLSDFSATGGSTVWFVYDYRHRAYSPLLGRWLQPDPIGFAAGDVNWYRYCRNCPDAVTDAFGLDVYPFLGAKPAIAALRLSPVGEQIWREVNRVSVTYKIDIFIASVEGLRSGNGAVLQRPDDGSWEIVVRIPDQKRVEYAREEDPEGRGVATQEQILVHELVETILILKQGAQIGFDPVSWALVSFSEENHYKALAKEREFCDSLNYGPEYMPGRRTQCAK